MKALTDERRFAVLAIIAIAAATALVLGLAVAASGTCW